MTPPVDDGPPGDDSRGADSTGGAPDEADRPGENPATGTGSRGPPDSRPRLPRGRLCRSRVVPDARTLLEDALDRRLTGYATILPGDALLLDADAGRGLLTFEDGVPVVAYHERTGRGGARALADLAQGPWRVELYACDPGGLAPVHDTAAWRVPPGVPAERLAAAPALAERTRRRAPDRAADDDLGPVEAFLDDEARVEALRSEARAEAERRAAEWGFDDAVGDG